MKTFNLKSLTNTELIAYQRVIKKIISIESPKPKKLKKLREQYAQLSQELYIRTKGITKIKPYMPRKNRIISETEKRIRELIKQFGSKKLNVCLQRFN